MKLTALKNGKCKLNSALSAMIIGAVLSGIAVTSVDAIFVPTTARTFYPDKDYNNYSGNYDDDFKEGKHKINIAYNDKDGNPKFIVKDKSNKNAILLTLPSPQLKYQAKVTQIQNKDNGQYFYIVDGRSDKYGYLMGLDKKTGKWRVYANKDNYYNPVGSSNGEGITLHYGNISVYHHGAKHHEYWLKWDERKNDFTYEDKDSHEFTYFNSALAYDKRYRPLYAHMGTEWYLDMKSITTYANDDNVCKFSCGIRTAPWESDIISDSMGRFNFKYYKQSKKLFFEYTAKDGSTKKLEELDYDKSPVGVFWHNVTAAGVLAYREISGELLGDLGGDLGYIEEWYKGPLD